MLQKYISPEGEEFIVEEQATNRILNEGIPFIIIDIKERRLTIKEDDLFVYCNMQGNIPADNTSGLGRLKRGQLFQPKLDTETLTLAYLGQDEVWRRTRIYLSDKPDWHRLELNRVILGYKLNLEPNGRAVLHF